MKFMDKKAKPKEKEIGNSAFTQAMGEAGNVGIIATVVSTVAIGAVLYFGKEKVSWIGTTLNKIEGAFDWIKKKVGNGGGGPNGSKKIKDMLAALTAASGAGYLIGHLAMLPAYKDGLNKARAEKELLRTRGEMIEMLNDEVAEKNAVIARLEGKSMASEEAAEECEQKWAKDSMKPKQPHSRGDSHSRAVTEEEPSTRSL